VLVAEVRSVGGRSLCQELPPRLAWLLAPVVSVSIWLSFGGREGKCVRVTNSLRAMFVADAEDYSLDVPAVISVFMSVMMR
jgi:hypothetical protein